MGEPLLRCEEVSVRFGGLDALRQLSLSLHEGDLVGIIGPNGSGKTTLINTITGLVRSSGGAIWFRGRRLDGLRPFEISRLGVGRTFQVMQQYGRMSVIENVMVGALYAAGERDPRRAERVAAEQLAFVGLWDRRDARVGDLTLADRKKLELVRALVRRPRLLFLDEVNAGLNPQEVRSVMGLIRETNGRGVTIVVVEHVMRVITGLCSRVVVLHHGECITDEPCETVTANPDVIRAYLGSRYSERWPGRAERAP